MAIDRSVGRRARLALCSAVVGVVLAGGLPAAAAAKAGGQPPKHSCGIGREEAAFLRQLPERPGAGEASLLDPHDPKQPCAGKG